MKNYKNPDYIAGFEGAMSVFASEIDRLKKLLAGYTQESIDGILPEESD